MRLVSNYTAPGVRIELQSENGLLGIGPYPTEAQVDPDLINAGKARFPWHGFWMLLACKEH